MSVAGLAQRIEALSVAYQADRPDLEMGDLTALGIQGLVRCAVSAVRPANAVQRDTSRVNITSIISNTRVQRVGCGSGSGHGPRERQCAARGTSARADARTRRTDHQGQGWTVAVAELQRWTMAYGVNWPQEPVAP